MKKLLTRKQWISVSGIGVGVIQNQISNQWGYFPVLGGWLPSPWNGWSSIGGIITGGVAFWLAQYAKFLKGKQHLELKIFLYYYGITTILGGIVNGITAAGQSMALTTRTSRNLRTARPRTSSCSSCNTSGVLGVSPMTGRVAAVPMSQELSGRGNVTNKYYPNYTGTFYRREQSPARGFGSDVTRNPMAKIPTKIPYNKIIS